MIRLPGYVRLLNNYYNLGAEFNHLATAEEVGAAEEEEQQEAAVAQQTPKQRENWQSGSMLQRRPGSSNMSPKRLRVSNIRSI